MLPKRQEMKEGGDRERDRASEEWTKEGSKEERKVGWEGGRR